MQMSSVHLRSSLQKLPGMLRQLPALQESIVHGLLSSQLTGTCVQPLVGSQTAVKHGFVTSQKESSGMCTQPVAGSQASVVH